MSAVSFRVRTTSTGLRGPTRGRANADCQILIRQAGITCGATDRGRLEAARLPDRAALTYGFRSVRPPRGPDRPSVLVDRRAIGPTGRLAQVRRRLPVRCRQLHRLRGLKASLADK